ncbi:MAG: GSCFA domain-containing protein [Bacteroidales bacterium]|nr:GSCFA domain-containing protein [Bacteroidales bacterium]
MEFRTVVKIDPSPAKISYKSRVMFIGSCFASSIGMKLEAGRIPVLINPAGTVYNPVSVSNTLDIILNKRIFSIDNLYNYEGTYLSFLHYTDFSSADPEKVIEKINCSSEKAHGFLKSADFLFITLGTARIYTFRETGEVVSNCHKLPASRFERSMLKVAEVVDVLRKKLDLLHAGFPDLKVVFTVSPVRHWKDGAHENQISKAVLHLATEELLSHPAVLGYFPAYEMLMDDLRDYRFYETDMLHPSSEAIDYIWESFANCYFDNNTFELWKEVERITRACSHVIKDPSAKGTGIFARKMIDLIEIAEAKEPMLDLSAEKDYFCKLLNGLSEKQTD